MMKNKKYPLVKKLAFSECPAIPITYAQLRRREEGNFARMGTDVRDSWKDSSFLIRYRERKATLRPFFLSRDSNLQLRAHT